ncbi:hypothetical protein [Streptomyces platensis]
MAVDAAFSQVAAGATDLGQTVDVLGAGSPPAAFGTLGLSLAGDAPGSSVPNADRSPLPLVALVVAVSLTPLALEVLRARRRRPATADPEEQHP